jgi:hypothetical protein
MSTKIPLIKQKEKKKSKMKKRKAIVGCGIASVIFILN